jgi:ribosome-associated protein
LPKTACNTNEAWRTPLSNQSKAQQAKPEQLDIIQESLDEDKAQDVLAIDLAGKTSIADYMVIASGRSQRHVSALSDHVVRNLKEEGYGRCVVEGMPNCDWVLIDAGDVIVHIFRPEVRDFYNLEKMWGPSPNMRPNTSEQTAV